MGNTKEKTLLNVLDTYSDLYAYLSKGKRSAADLKQYLETAGKSKTNARMHVKAARDGELLHIKCEGDVLSLNHEGLAKDLQELCGRLSLDAQITPKKKKLEEDISSVTSGVSKQFREMKSKLDTANATQKQMEEMLAEKQSEVEDLKMQIEKLRCIIISKAVDTKVLIPKSVESDPPEVLAKDFFNEMPRANMEVIPMVSKAREDTERPGLYVDNTLPEKELTEENFITRICRQFKDGFLGKIVERQERNPIRESTQVDLKRQQAIELLLADEDMTNQTKLATYAAWYFHGDPDMEELLYFAGEHSINANYVIRLLEKPAEYQNYRTMRAFLKQVQSASEAHIKRETVQELLCGDWQAVAVYCGKPCHLP